MHDDAPSGPLRTWLSTLPALLVLLIAVAQGTSEIVQARMLALGEEAWPGYAELRRDPPPPTCDPEAIGAASPEGPAVEGGDVLDDLFGDAPAGGAAGGDLLDDLLGGEEAGPSAEAVAAARAACEGQHARHAELQARITPAVKAYRTVDHLLTAVTDFGRSSAKVSLVFLIAICAATASALRAHIALRPARTRLDNLVSEGAQVVVCGVAAASFLARYAILSGSGVDVAQPWVALLWAAGFGAMALASLRHLIRPPEGLASGGSPGAALLTVPLYTTMGAIASAWFLLVEGHPSGLAIFVDNLTQHAGLYLQVGLFVWAGMLLKRTALPHRAFDVLRPWRLPPELLTAVVVIAAAVPTAYSGASGIFVIAAGAVIYDELRRAGARNQLALAATALSGSLGVVLSPCLLVVIVASLNKQVTTGELFTEGYRVFALTAVLLVAALLLTRRSPLTTAPPREALPTSLRALGSLAPYALLLVGTLLFYGLALQTWLDEHSAARIVLVVLLLFVLYEGTRDDGTTAPRRIAGSTTETTVHIGALLALMAFSIGFGGVIERADVMGMVPTDLGSPVVAMAVLTVMLVGIGMVMDPYGAVILVSATLAHVAYDNGIAPLHFWMVVLVAFELGYLTPPVALNHLLTRMVVGDAAGAPEPAGASFWQRHERYLLPISVMTTALLLVAFVPLALGPGADATPELGPNVELDPELLGE